MKIHATTTKPYGTVGLDVGGRRAEGEVRALRGDLELALEVVKRRAVGIEDDPLARRAPSG